MAVFSVDPLLGCAGPELKVSETRHNLPSDHNTLHLGTPGDLKISRKQVKHQTVTISKCM